MGFKQQAIAGLALFSVNPLQVNAWGAAGGLNSGCTTDPFSTSNQQVMK